MNDTARFSPGRRKLLIGSAATVATLGVVGAASWGRLKNYRAEWVEQVVRSSLPGVDIDNESLTTFVEHILSSERMRRAQVKATVFADQFVPWLPARVAKAREGLVGLERHVLTEYLLGSNFFRVSDPRQARIVYQGPALGCANPFIYAAGATQTAAIRRPAVSSRTRDSAARVTELL